MDLATRLKLVARKLTDPEHEIRHALLDVADEVLAIASEPQEFPERLRDEVRALAAEIEAIQPRFRSHRLTSVLFDREGLGLRGRERAKALALRIIDLYRLVERTRS